MLRKILELEKSVQSSAAEYADVMLKVKNKWTQLNRVFPRHMGDPRQGQIWEFKAYEHQSIVQFVRTADPGGVILTALPNEKFKEVYMTFKPNFYEFYILAIREDERINFGMDPRGVNVCQRELQEFYKVFVGEDNDGLLFNLPH